MEKKWGKVLFHQNPQSNMQQLMLSCPLLLHQLIRIRVHVTAAPITIQLILWCWNKWEQKWQEALMKICQRREPDLPLSPGISLPLQMKSSIVRLWANGGIIALPSEKERINPLYTFYQPDHPFKSVSIFDIYRCAFHTCSIIYRTYTARVWIDRCHS